MKRKTLAIIAGIIVGGLFIALGEVLSTYIFPLETPIPTDHTLTVDHMEYDIPFGSKLILVINWAISAFVASIASTFISGRDSPKPMFAVVSVLNVLTLIQLFIFPHPKWMWISSILVFIPIGYIAYLLIRKKNTNERV